MADVRLIRIRAAARRSLLTSLAACVALASLAATAAAQQPLTAHDVQRLQVVTASAVSPDGREIAFLRGVPRNPLEQSDGGAWIELHVIDADGAERAFVTGEVNVAALAWTPDGRGLSFLARRSGDETRSLYVIPRGGGEARKVVSHGADIAEYTWSPDGKRVAFLAPEPKSREQRELERKGFTQLVVNESARPVRLWIAEVAASGTTTSATALELEGSAADVSWSPQGNRLALTLAPTSTVDDSYMRKRLHVVDAAAGQVVTRVDNPGKIGDIAWSPDGSHVAYVSAADATDPLEGRLMVVPATGGAPRDLLAGWDEGHVTQVAWRDNDRVLFLADQGVGTFLGSVPRAGGRFSELQAHEGVVMTAISVAEDGERLSMVGESPSHPPEVFAAPRPDAEPQRLTRSNPWLAEQALAPQEVVRYKARDGLELQGLLIRPLNEVRGQRYPLVVIVHGGPESHYANGWLTGYSTPGQVLAGAGFAVFYPNYRGSTGRGVAFSKVSQGDPAGPEFDDIVDGVDHLVASGLADRARVGITGGSYGGYATAWGATRYSDRFAAAVMFVGIGNKLSKTMTSDIPNELRAVHERKWPWEDWQFFLERSPIYHVDKARTPILILHGDEDPRVHPSQSIELYNSIRLRTDTPVRLVLYPGEGHGNRRAAARLDYTLRLVRWMEHYLKGPGGAPPPYEIDYQPAATASSN